jgi:hypothetical protein
VKFVVEDWLVPWTVQWPDKSTGPWTVTLRWRADRDRVECIGLDVQAMDPTSSETVTATLMRALPVARLIAQARQERYEEAGGSVMEAVAAGEDLDVGSGLIEQIEDEATPWRPPRAGRPVDLTPDFYAQVADVYSLALLSGTAPLRAVERQWTTSRPTASRWVAAARKLGLLPETQKGRAKGAAVNETTEDEQ